MSKRITVEEWQKRSDSVHGVGQYSILTLGKTSITKSQIVCNTCGTSFLLDMHHLCRSGRGCPVCSKKRTRLSAALWQEKSDAVHGKGAYTIVEAAVHLKH